jgi:hypothetical protein
MPSERRRHSCFYLRTNSPPDARLLLCADVSPFRRQLSRRAYANRADGSRDATAAFVLKIAAKRRAFCPATLTIARRFRPSAIHWPRDLESVGRNDDTKFDFVALFGGALGAPGCKGEIRYDDRHKAPARNLRHCDQRRACAFEPCRERAGRGAPRRATTAFGLATTTSSGCAAANATSGHAAVIWHNAAAGPTGGAATRPR